ncbi:MAG: Flp pilus assembly complex ATPase component TadA [Nitrospirae bacterium]|nr:Flp pilus assembly complex ATPase component TadA [Nitrospirota bacterium]
MPVNSVSVLGELLVRSRIATEEHVQEAFNISKKENRRLGSVLVKMGFVNEKALLDFFSRQYKVPIIDLSTHQIDIELVKKIPFDRARRKVLIPVTVEGDSLIIAIADPTNTPAIDDVKFITKMKVVVHVATESAILKAIEQYYPEIDQQKASEDVHRSQEETTLDTSEIDSLIDKTKKDVEQKEENISLSDASVSPIIQLVNAIVMNAISERASDIHIEPSQKESIVRYRVDGELKQAFPPFPYHIHRPIVARIKEMARIDIANVQIPQYGKIKIMFGESAERDFIVSTVHLPFGERVVMKIVDKSMLFMDISSLGFDETQLHNVINAIDKSYGMVLVTGPAGSGKTTTLYSLLSHSNKPGVNIMTVEAPIEFIIPNVNQLQVQPWGSFSYAEAVRSFLYQDPDVIMIGEMKDKEIAELGIDIVSAGHLVLSSLYTVDTTSTIVKLLNMGIQPFLISSSVSLVTAQRFVRKICNHCKREQHTYKPFLNDVLIKSGVASECISGFKSYMGAGCDLCDNTGYKGRLVLHEVMPIGAELKDIILNGGNAVAIKEKAVNLGMMTLRQIGLKKANEGLTSIDEVLRNTDVD